MNGWKSNENVAFNFHDAHELKSLTDRASDETIYRRLRERFSNAKQVVVIIGEHTKHLHKFVRWEIAIAPDLNPPVVAVNLNASRGIGADRCPTTLRGEYVVHIPFKAAILQHGLVHFPSEHANRGSGRGPRYYEAKVYQNLGQLT